MPKVLIIDDEKDICFSLIGLLDDEGYESYSAQSLEEAWPFILKNPPDLILLDVWLGKDVWDGLEALQRLQQHYPLIPVVMMSGHGTVSMACHALKKGAKDFLEKPLEGKKLLHLVERYVYSSAKEKNFSSSSFQEQKSLDLWPEVFKDHQWKFFDHREPLLLMGPPGSQALLLAKAIYQHQKNHGQSKILGFIDGRSLNNMSQEAWFGSWEKSPTHDYTAQKIRKPGWLENFHGGTVIVHNIQDLEEKWQQYWLRFLQKPEHHFSDSKEPIVFDIRFIFTAIVQENPKKSTSPNKVHISLEKSSSHKYNSSSNLHFHSPSNPQSLQSNSPSNPQSPQASSQPKETLDQNFFSLQNPRLLKPFYYGLLAHSFYIDPLHQGILDVWIDFFLRHLDYTTMAFSSVFLPSVEKIFQQQRLVLDPKARDFLKTLLFKGDREELFCLLLKGLQGWQKRGSSGHLLLEDFSFHHHQESWITPLLEEPLKKARALFEWHYMNHHYQRIQGNVTQVAKVVGMNRAALHRKMRLLEDFLQQTN